MLKWFIMPVIIDGYNYIGAIRDISLDDINKEDKLVNKMLSFIQKKKTKITIVFDGQKGWIHDGAKKYKKGAINVVFSPSSSSADEMIKGMVDKSDHKRDLVVVSSDRDVFQHAIKKGAKAVNCSDFEKELKKMSIKGEKQLNCSLTKAEVDYWMETFGS